MVGASGRMVVIPFSRRFEVGILVIGLALLGGCEKLTEIVVSIDTDMKIPAELDAVGFQSDYVYGQEKTTVAFKTWEVDLNRPNAIKLPATIGLLPGDELDIPVLITVSGYLQDKLLLTRKAQLTFVEGRVLLLSMNLLRGCLYKVCPEDQTCGESGCEPIEKDSTKLPDYGEDAAFKGVGDAVTDISVDAGVPDTLVPDGSTPDLELDAPVPDLSLPDTTPDLPAPDLPQPDTTPPDGPLPDLVQPPDAPAPDTAPIDLGTVDQSVVDQGCSWGPTASHAWSKGFGGTAYDEGTSVAVDPNGNLYVTGYFTGSVSFGGNTLASAGGTDIFVASFDQNGGHRWSKGFGGTADDHGWGIAVDPSGNVSVTGDFPGTVSFGGNQLTSAGGTDLFVASFDQNGGHRWSKGFGGTGDDAGRGVAADSSGNLLATGGFSGAVSFGGSQLTSAGGTDIFVASFDQGGGHRWSQGYGATNDDDAYSVAVDGSGNAAVTGEFNGTVSFGGSNLVSAGKSDVFVASFSSSGGHLWSKGYGGAQIDIGRGVAAGGGTVIVTGSFAGSAGFGGTTLTSAGLDDIFVAVYGAGGAHLWSKGFGSKHDDIGYGVAADALGNGYVTGVFHQTVDFGGGGVTSLGAEDIFLVSFGPGGAHRWSIGYGSTTGISKDIGFGVAVDSCGKVLGTGVFKETINFGGLDITATGNTDLYLLKLDQ